MYVSIITAAFSATYIENTWQSIKKQTHKDWEWIIVCDNSEEIRDWFNEFKVPREEDNDIWFIDISKNQARYGLVARNVGVMCSKYNRIVFLDDDNEFEEEDYLEELIKVEKKTGKIPYTKLHLIGKKPDSTYDRYKKTALARHNIDLGNPFYRKRFFNRYGYFDDSQNKIMFDWDLIKKIKDGEGEDMFVRVDRNLFFRHKRY